MPLLAGCTGGAEGPAVVVLVLDGVNAHDSFGAGPSVAGVSPDELMPECWDELVPDAARATSAWNLGATITGPAHAALVSGRRQALANYAVEGGVGLYRPELPGIFEALRDAGYGEGDLLLAGNTRLVEPVAHSLLDGVGAAWLEVESDSRRAYDRDVLAALQERLETDQPRLVLANLHQSDLRAHYGEEGDYVESVREIDTLLVDFYDDLRRTRGYRDAHLVVVADHGRHLDAETDPVWRSHGDSCAGCRRVPLLVLGPEAATGTVATPVHLVDLAPTLAGLFGVELPWAEGRVATELFERELPASRTGVASFAAAGPYRAEVRYLEGAARRTELVVGDVVISSEDATEVASPALAWDGSTLTACWRELSLDGGEWLPWSFRCAQLAEGTWQALDPPVEDAGPFWHVSLAADPELGLVAAWAHNPSGISDTLAQEKVMGVQVAKLVDEGWVTSSVREGDTFSMHPSLVVTGDGPVVGYGASIPGVDARHHRRLEVASAGRGLGWASEVEIRDGLVDGGLRLERPTLHQGADGLELAAVLSMDEGVAALVGTPGLDGEQELRIPILPGEVLPHVTPVWLEGAPVFGVALDGGHGVCRVEDVPSCAEVGPRLGALGVGDEGLLALVDVEVGDWEVVEVELPQGTSTR